MNQYIPICSTRYARVVDCIARLLLSEGYRYTTDWKLLAQQLGIRCFEQVDWNQFWLSVIMLMVDNSDGFKYYAVTVKQVKELVIPMAASTFKPRRQYLIEACGGSDAIHEYRTITQRILYAASQDAERMGVDRPSWFNEMNRLYDSISDVKLSLPRVGDPAAALASEVQIKDRHILFEGKEYTPESAQALAKLLLDSVNLSQEQSIQSEEKSDD